MELTILGFAMGALFAFFLQKYYYDRQSSNERKHVNDLIKEIKLTYKSTIEIANLQKETISLLPYNEEPMISKVKNENIEIVKNLKTVYDRLEKYIPCTRCGEMNSPLDDYCRGCNYYLG